MPSLGERGNVMGPQPIGQRTAVPADMLECAGRVLDLLAGRRETELTAMGTPGGARELSEVIAAIEPGAYSAHEIIANARINQHHYIKARLIGAKAAPCTVQFRLGLHDGRWIVWEAMNLTAHAAWTR
jgi:hypothetical protein